MYTVPTGGKKIWLRSVHNIWRLELQNCLAVSEFSAVAFSLNLEVLCVGYGKN